jgi:ribosomal protein S18 acetylase RimI-like enzyme
MSFLVRPARPADAAAPLLYASAATYYDAYAGDPEVARALVAALYPVRGHAASWDVCLVAEADRAEPDRDRADAGPALAGVLAAFPAGHADTRARRFVVLSLPKLGLRRWPVLVGHLRAAARVSPVAPADSWYVDALAVAPAQRRRGVARALLEAAEAAGRDAGARTLALDTGLENAEAQALYEALGFQRGAERHATGPRIARALGGSGFVSYTKPIG